MSDDNWIALAKNRKQETIDEMPGSNMYPIVIAVRDGEPWIQIVIPDMNPNFTLSVARMLRVLMDPDSISLFLDVYYDMEVGHKPEDMEAVVKKLQSRDLRQDFLNGHPKVSEAIHYFTVSRECDFHSIMMPYVCVDNIIIWKEIFNESIVSSTGRICDTMKAIMKQPVLVDTDPVFQEASKELNFSRERQLFHAMRAIRYHIPKECRVTDLISPKHPEWVET